MRYTIKIYKYIHKFKNYRKIFEINLLYDSAVEESNKEKKMRRSMNWELSKVAKVEDVELNIKIDKEFRNEINEVGLMIILG